MHLGLGGGTCKRNFPDAVGGVYLANDPLLAIGFLVDHLLEEATDDTNPSLEVASWRVIVIDDSRVDSAKLLPDPQLPHLDSFALYTGIIDVTGMPVLDTDQFGPA